jgi:hypothetical protein
VSIPERLRRHRGALLAGALGLLARALVTLLSVGSNDATTWEAYGELILHGDLLETYRVYKAFNHPPLPGYLAMVAYDLSRTTGLRFQILFKLLPMASDVVVAVLLYQLWEQRRQGARAVALYAASIVAILACSYHGNTDSMAACLCLAGVLLWDRGRWLGAGLALGAALNVKLIPAPLVLAVALLAPDRRVLGRYLGGLALAALPFVPVLLLVPRAFFRNAIAYNSLPNPWGVMAFLEAARQTPHFAAPAEAAFAAFRAAGRYLVVLFPLAAALWGRRRGWSARRLGAVTMLAFLVLTPGFSVHYLIYAVPLLFALDLTAGAVASTVGGVFALSYYLAFWTGGRPWYSDFSRGSPPLSILLGLLAWLVLVRALYTAARTGWAGAAGLRPPAPGTRPAPPTDQP